MFLCTKDLTSSGFGDTMIDTPMVIMWNNTDGTATLSQRMATAYMQPFIDSNPPFQASIATAVRMSIRVLVAAIDWSFSLRLKENGHSQSQYVVCFSPSVSEL